jgi:hypothetical protein
MARLAAEDEIRISDLSWTILRPTMIYGAAGDRNLSRLLVLLARLRGAPVPRAAPLVVPLPGGGRQLQQPVHVADLAGAVLTAVERPEAARHRYEVAGPEPLTFAEVLRASAAAVGRPVHLVPVPLAPLIALTRGYERVSRRPRIRVEQWQRLAEDKAFPIDAAARDLDYAPRPFAEGIRAEAADLGLTPPSPPRRPPPPSSRPASPPHPSPCSPPAPSPSASPEPPSRPSTLMRRIHAQHRQEPPGPDPWSARATARAGPYAVQLRCADELQAAGVRHQGDYRRW